MSDDDPDHALREVKRKIFGDSTATIPRVFLNVVRRHVHPDAHVIGWTNSEPRYPWRDLVERLSIRHVGV